MNTNKLRVVIAGGGTAGWMTATALVKQLGHRVDVVLVESDQIGTVGVGEATIPTMQTFHLLLQLDEQEFIRETKATFKLGIQFENWGQKGDKYFHSFGETGRDTWAGQFQHFWLRGKKEGINYPFGHFSPAHQAAMAEKFSFQTKPRLGYAYHLDATLYAQYLRKISEGFGVERIEGKIQEVTLNTENGYIDALKLESGDVVSGDLFIDCTGFSGLLIEKALNTGFESWSDMLLCDRAIAMQTQSIEAPIPYTKAIAHEAGWQWQIPLQHRTGNGLVYSSKYLDEGKAEQLLLNNVQGEPVNDPRHIGFTPGRRKKIWQKNCVAIGLSSGFLEPLESTSIHLISSAIIRLMRFIPLTKTIPHTDIEEFNKQAQLELESIRDFIVLHYKATNRTDSKFWRYCKDMAVPDSLMTRMSIYADSARIFWSEDELFTVNSWNQVMLGQGILPRAYHPIADVMSSDELHQYLNGYRESIAKLVEKLPAHHKFIKDYAAKSVG